MTRERKRQFERVLFVQMFVQNKKATYKTKCKWLIFWLPLQDLNLRPSDCHYEEFLIVVLNKANRVSDRYRISEGVVSGTVVDIRRIFHHTLNILGTSLILIHNHPSGNVKPSEADINITKKIVEAGKLFDIVVLDHLVIGAGYYSFADNGMI